MANTRSLCLCTLLVATTLMQGCRGQCDGNVKVLVATEEAKTFGPPGFFINPPYECEWVIRAEDDYIVHIRFTMKNVDDNWRHLCSREVSLYDGAYPERAKFINTFCADTDHDFSTSGQNMYVIFHPRAVRWLDFTMEYWAAEENERQEEVPDDSIRDYDTAAPTIAYTPAFFHSLMICSIILGCCCCCYCCCCRYANRRASPFCDSAPSSSHNHHDDQVQVVIFTGGNSSISRTDGIRANSSGAVPLLSAPQPEASDMGRRSLADSPPAYDDLELVVISTGGNSSTSRPGGVHTSSSIAVPVTAEPLLEDFNIDRRSLDDSPPAYDAVVTSDINRSEENPQETLTVRLPSYSEAAAMVNMATKPK